MESYPDTRKALRVLEEHKHWIYKQAPQELESAIQELIAFAKVMLEQQDK